MKKYVFKDVFVADKADLMVMTKCPSYKTKTDDTTRNTQERNKRQR